jgi:hypothetical protein
MSGKSQFPFLVDSNTGLLLFVHVCFMLLTVSSCMLHNSLRGSRPPDAVPQRYSCCAAGKQLLESDDIIKYLYDTYGDGKVRPIACGWSPLKGVLQMPVSAPAVKEARTGLIQLNTRWGQPPHQCSCRRPHHRSTQQHVASDPH